MPIFFQHAISESSRLGIWKIEETEAFFKHNVPYHRDVTHPHKRLQHLAGRFLLQFLFPDFPYDLIRIAETNRPFLHDEQYHFSISHCGDYAAAIVSRTNRVGIDIEIPKPQIVRISQKFLSPGDVSILHHSIGKLNSNPDIYRGQIPNSDLDFLNPQSLTLLWSAKEAIFKWYGSGGVDFRKDIRLLQLHEGLSAIDCFFEKTAEPLVIHYNQFEQLTLAWVVS